jgi:hypothetical protein
MPAKSSVNRPRARAWTVAILFIANSKKRALVDAALAEKVRPKYDMLHKQPREQARLRSADDKVDLGSCDEHAATIDLTRSKHAHFAGSSSTTCASAFGINHPLENFLDLWRARSENHLTGPIREANGNATAISVLPQCAFGSINSKQPFAEVIQPTGCKGWHSDALDCATRRRSTCRCAESVARQQHRETWR